MDTPPETRVDPRFARYRGTRDRALRNEIVVDHHWLAVHCAGRFAHRGEPRDDLVQVAVVGLVNAVERFDPDRGVAFTTFAVPTITGELRRHFRDRTWSLHVPRRAKERYRAVAGAVDELTPALGRSPAIGEIAAHADLTVEEALEALEVGGSYRGVAFASGEDEEGQHERALGVEDGGYESAEARHIVRGLVRRLPTRRDRLIVTLRFVHGLTQAEIAAVVGVSQVQVSRLLRINLDRMRRAARRPPRSRHRLATADQPPG
jgi:RNA polymerase sigma-B factor